METVKNLGNQISETVQGQTSRASKEANKNVAMDSDASATTRLKAGKDAISDKSEQHSHGTKGEVTKETAKK